jgi:hypothetical protein
LAVVLSVACFPIIVRLKPDGTPEGHIYFHLGDDSAFRAERFSGVAR